MHETEYPKYLQVDLDFIDLVEELVRSSTHLKVFYFDPKLELADAKGTFVRVDKNLDGEFIVLNENPPVRLDRIITINGKVGPAYEEYDGFANACFSCLAGYEKSENI